VRHTLLHFKFILSRQEATAEQQRLTRALEEAEQRANEAEKEAAALGEEVEALEKKVNTLEINAKYDASARDGQVKRSRIMQAELEETREDNAKMEDRMRELERNKAVLNQSN
jgi:polyhydroxyalkanoate synthesis regulator phasin